MVYRYFSRTRSRRAWRYLAAEAHKEISTGYFIFLQCAAVRRVGRVCVRVPRNSPPCWSYPRVVDSHAHLLLFNFSRLHEALNTHHCVCISPFRTSRSVHPLSKVFLKYHLCSLYLNNNDIYIKHSTEVVLHAITQLLYYQKIYTTVFIVTDNFLHKREENH